MTDYSTSGSANRLCCARRWGRPSSICSAGQPVVPVPDFSPAVLTLSELVGISRHNDCNSSPLLHRLRQSLLDF